MKIKYVSQTTARLFLLLSVVLLFIHKKASTQVVFAQDSSTVAEQGRDSLLLNSRDSTGYYPNNELYLHTTGAVSQVDMTVVKNLPYTSVNQMLIGRATGVDVRIPSAEPGKRSGVFVRGTSSLLLNNADVFDAQPLYVVDGVPLIFDHPFAYDIQRFDFNRLGTEADLLSFLDVNDIESIAVLKDFAASAKYGPGGANGVILITTKGPRVGRMKVDVNTYGGYFLYPDIKPVNAKWERDFERPFYDQYATAVDYGNFPLYLGDSTQSNYYGPANWNDLYYRNGTGSGVQADVSGGNDLATFRFSLGRVNQQGVADQTGMTRYDVNFGINIVPFKNLTVTTFLQAATLNRSRNHSILSRINDEEYIFNLESPPSPNKAAFRQYYVDLEDGIDNNKNNSVRLLANARYTFLKHFTLNSRFGIDYGQNLRQLFIPSTLSGGNNFVSDFDGLNRLLVLDNSFQYDNTFGGKHHVTAGLGQYGQWMSWRYDYGKAYKGYNDYIKIYAPGNANNHQGTSNDFRLTANYKDYTHANLASFYANIDYDFERKYFLSVYLREDASSNVAAENRWLFSPTVSASWKISNEAFFEPTGLFSSLDLHASWGKIGRVIMNELYKGGPVYNVDAGWNGTPNISTYNSYPVLNAAFSTGYVVPGIQWPFVTQANVGINAGLLNERLRLSLDVYTKTDKNRLLKVPSTEAYGYTGIVNNGLSVRNYGAELQLQAGILLKHAFQWYTALSAYTNQNELRSLPGGLDEIVINDRLFKVGQPIDKYWVYVNEGIYTTDDAVPVNPQTQLPMTFQGVPLQAGDPRFKDINGDQLIDNEDRVLKGRLSPQLAGGWSNDFHYKRFTLRALFNYAFGRQVINQALSNRFDFINRQNVSDPSAVKDVTFWQILPGDFDQIPRYNPWSKVNPYQSNQTIFLEDASYVKLRSVTLSYDFHGKWMDKLHMNLLKLYVTGNHLWTWTNYSGDPTAVDYFGYDNGAYNWSFPKSFTVGLNFQF